MQREMPELKNEIPTEEELYRYFMESCPRLMEPQFEDDETSEALRLGCDRLLRKVGECIFESLQRLNTLPRTDPFWRNTNKRPTIFKLSEFGRDLLKLNADDRQALWLKASLAVFYGAHDFGSENWKRLRELGDFDVSWAVLAGLWNEVNLGFGPGGTASLLLEMEATEEARPLLELCAGSKSVFISEWAQGVLALIQANRKIS